MLPRRLLPLVVVACAWLAVPAAARAQDASSQAAAEALFREGRTLYDAGKYPEACAKFAESQRLDPAPGTQLNLAGCYEKNGQTASAWVTFKAAMGAAHQKGRADWEELARQRVAALEPTLSRLTIVVNATAEGLIVRRDGADVGRAEWGTAIPVDPGTHVVEAQAPQRKPLREPVEVGGNGGTATVTLPELAPEATEVAGTTSDGSTQRAIGLVVAGVGVVGLGIGSAFGLVAMGKENDALNNHCPNQPQCDATGVQLGQDAKSAATASTVAFAVGGVALAGGLVLYFTAPKRAAPAASVGFRAAPAHGGASFGLEARW
ncbi:MAG TPA: tetratricopeptide repeat protein [Polyangiaceae bacterium]|jgi:hypothetical protein